MPYEHDIWHWQEPCHTWKGAGLYHVTLKVPSRLPLLGTLIIPDNDPSHAFVERTVLGDALIDRLLLIFRFHPEIQVLHFCLMPDHLHMIWYARKTMSKGIRSVARGFLQSAKQLGRASSYVESNAIRQQFQEEKNHLHSCADSLRKQLGDDAYYALPPIFTEMPFIRPMGRRRQLPATIRYIDMNPQRLATKRLMPGFFRVQDNIEIGGRVYKGIGNIDLLDAQHYMPVHVRRTMMDEATHGDETRLRDYMEGCIAASEKGAVMVSPFIHEKEREVLYDVLSKGGKVIYLADNGFGEYYKPSDGIFDAVANKQILILSPWSYDPKKKHISRSECVALNQMAEEICLSSSI